MGLFKHKRQSRDEFRYNYKTKHINYVFEEDGIDYHSLGITHKKKTIDKNKKRHKNMPLENNVQKTKKEKSYVRYGVITQNGKSYGRIDKRYSFSEEDKLNVKAKIRNYKKNRKK